MVRTARTLLADPYSKFAMRCDAMLRVVGKDV